VIAVPLEQQRVIRHRCSVDHRRDDLVLEPLVAVLVFAEIENQANCARAAAPEALGAVVWTVAERLDRLENTLAGVLPPRRSP